METNDLLLSLSIMKEHDPPKCQYQPTRTYGIIAQQYNINEKIKFVRIQSDTIYTDVSD